MASTTTGKSDLGRILDMVNGFQRTCVLVAAVELGVFEALATGRRDAEALAAELGVDRPTLSRLLRALAVLQLASLDDSGAMLTSSGRLLLKGGFASGVAAWISLIGGEYLSLWGRLSDSVRTGEPIFDKIFDCSPWKHREDHPALNEAFNQVTTAEQLRTTSALLRSYDFTGARCIVDVGGGHGNLVCGVLKKYREARGIVFDLPHVVDGADDALVKAGVGERCRVVPGSFLDAVPAGGDVHLLKHVLHNWDDEHCLRILRNARAALAPDGRLLVLEDVLATDDPAKAAPVVMLDIHMLVVHGGRERTIAEYATLLKGSGFRMSRHIETRGAAPDIIEALPV
jgi:hypothetical protein